MILFLLALLFLLFRLWSPTELLFDEGYYTVAATHMLHGEPDSNPEHPPLGKLLIAAGMKLAGNNSVGWRLAPAFFGALLLVVIFCWMWQYGEATAWAAVLLTVANGFWFAMSRVAMISIFELTFAVAGLWMLSLRRDWLCGIALGLAMACRWNALFAIALALLYAAAEQAPPSARIRAAGKVALGCAAAYAAAWLPMVGLHPVRFLQAQLFIVHYHRNFTSGNPVHNEPWHHWLLRTFPEGWLHQMVANPVITVLGIAATLLLLRRGNLVALAGAVFLLQWAITPRTFSYYYYYLDAVTMFSLALASVAGRYRLPLGRHSLRLVIPVTGIALLWFVAHYAQFVELGAPYDTLFQLWR